MEDTQIRDPSISGFTLEELYQSLFGERDENLDRLLALQAERRATREILVETVVTYGAYEEPI